MDRLVRPALLLLAILIGAGIAVLAATVDSGRRLGRLAAAPVSECDGTVPPVRPPAETRQQEVDNGIIHFLIDGKGIEKHWAYVGTYQLYSAAARLKTTPEQRRLLYARLPCAIRPKTLPVRVGKP